jgi:hypothetical protein
LLVSTLFLASTASAITIDFSSFSPGPTGEPLVIGDATFTSEGGALEITTTSALVTGLTDGGIGTGATGDITVDFAVPIVSISVTMGDGGADEDAFRVSLFDFTTNALISVTDSPVFDGGDGSLFTLTVGGLNIGRAVIDPGNSGVLPGVRGGPAGGVLLTTLDFSPIPEPTTALLVAFGLVGMGMRRRSAHPRTGAAS